MERIHSITATVVRYDDQPTVQATVTTDHGFTGTAELPSGVSVGANEAAVVSPEQALATIAEVVAPALAGMDALEQREVDERLMELDGTEDRSHLGVTSLLPVSLAIARAAAAALQRELYVHLAELAHTTPTLPELIQVMLEGGKHAPLSGVTVQEFSLIDSPQQGTNVLAVLRQQLAAGRVKFSVGGEGGLVAAWASNRAALTALTEALAATGQSHPRLALDVAASHGLTPLAEVSELITDFPLALVEDPIDQSKLSDWATFTAQHGQDLLIAADDLTVGNPILIKDAVKQAVANCLVLKLTQTATLSELFDLIALVGVGGWAHVVSHRGHETPDSFLVDLAVGTGAKFLKMGTTESQVRRSKFDRYEEIKRSLARTV